MRIASGLQGFARALSLVDFVAIDRTVLGDALGTLIFGGLSANSAVHFLIGNYN